MTLFVKMIMQMNQKKKLLLFILKGDEYFFIILLHCLQRSIISITIVLVRTNLPEQNTVTAFRHDLLQFTAPISAYINKSNLITYLHSMLNK